MRTALRLVDDQGLAALTMRALSHELEVSPMALYNHVRDKEELGDLMVDLMLDLMLGEVDCSPSHGDWVANSGRWCAASTRCCPPTPASPGSTAPGSGSARTAC